MKYKNTTTKTLLLIVLILAIAGLSAYYLYFVHIKKDGEMASGLKNEIDLLAEKSARLNSIKAILDDTASDRAKLSAAIIASDGVANFAGELETLGDDFGVKVGITSFEIKSLAGAGAEGLEILSIRLSAEGSWRQVTKFFSALENLKYAARLNQVTLNKTSNAKLGSVWQATFSAEVLKRK